MPPGHAQPDADRMWTPVLQRLSGADTSKKESNLSSGQRGDISGRSECVCVCGGGGGGGDRQC